MVRIKNRYLLVEIILENSVVINGLSTYSLKDTILQPLTQLYGTLHPEFQVKYYSPYTGLCIIRVNRENENAMRHGLFFYTSLRSHKAKARVIKCSGTIKKLQQWLVGYDLEMLKKRKVKNLEKIAAENREKIEALVN